MPLIQIEDMPLIQIEGEDQMRRLEPRMYRRGYFLRSVLQDGGVMVRKVVRCMDGIWRLGENLEVFPPPVEEPPYPLPVLEGWDHVPDGSPPEDGAYYVYICIDPHHVDYHKFRNPSISLDNQGRFNPAFGMDSDEGWAIYKRKKRTGPQRLLPSPIFSNPLPLP